jgi:hypothetical protein
MAALGDIPYVHPREVHDIPDRRPTSVFGAYDVPDVA